MILTIHGAFDSRLERNNGVSTLSDRLRELRLTEDFQEIDVHDWVNIDLLHLTAEPSVFVGYSNGFHQLTNILDSSFSTLTPSEIARTNVNLFCIDGVHFGGGMLAPRWHMAPYVRQCWNFMRTELTGLPPWHQMIDKDAPPQFQTKFIVADHGRIPSTNEVQDAVCDETKAIWKRFSGQ